MTRIGRRLLGLTFDNRPIWEPANAGSSICFAAAGGGKTTCVAVPAVQSLISDHSRAIFANDVKNGEVASQIGDMCIKHGRKFGAVDDFEVLGPNYPHRITLNPFGSVTEALKRSASHLPFIIENISHALIDEPKDDQKNFYWRESPRGYIEHGANLLLDRNPRLVYPGSLHALLADPMLWDKALDVALAGMDSSLAAAARQMVALRDQNPEHDAQHKRAALSALKIFGFGPLAEVGRTATLTHAELIRDGWIVCFVNPARYADRLGAYYALQFLGLMNAQLDAGAGKADYILDEFCNAPLRDALNRVTIQRAFGARSHFIAQSRQDIVRKYGEKEAALLEENCTIKQYLKFSNYEEAERVSKAMGETRNVSRGLGLASDKQGYNTNWSTGRERLMTPDELMRLPGDEQILHITDVGFIHCKKIRQNQIAPYCFDLADNPLEGGRLQPDPKVTLAASPRKDTP